MQHPPYPHVSTVCNSSSSPRGCPGHARRPSVEKADRQLEALGMNMGDLVEDYTTSQDRARDV